MSGVRPAAATSVEGRTLGALRRRLHRIPEVGLHLPRTQEMLFEQLAQLPFEAVRAGDAQSSLTAVLRGARPGPTVLLRADMDALPVREQTGLDFAAVDGAMHACGHDLHMAGLVGAARRLAAHRNRFAGSVVFAFQPGEEGHGGGRIMVNEGVLEAAGARPVACYCIHVWPTLPRGVFRTRAGAVMAGMNALTVTVTGTGGHASSPHLVRDPVPVISEIVLALQTFVGRRIDVRDPVVVSVTQLSAQSAAINVIPETSGLGASIRTLSPGAVDLVERELPQLAAGIAAAHGCVAEVEFERTYPVTMNTPAEVARAGRVLGAEFGEERFELLEAPLMASEDFAFFLDEAPGAFLLMGARPDDLSEEEAQPAHSPRAVFDDTILDDYARALEALALDALQHPDADRGIVAEL